MLIKKNNIQKYELQFASYFSTKKAFSFWKGRVALYAILKSMGIGPGDEIILPGYTCVMNVNPIKYLGAKPVYVDIEPNTFNINTNLLEKATTPSTKIIIAQHTYGYPCNMDTIMNIAARNNVAVIEDCCLSFGSKYKGKIVGTFGKASYFSSQWNKPYTTGLGGMVLVNDSNLAKKIEQVKNEQACQATKKEVFMLRSQLVIYRLFIYPRTTALAQNIFRYLAKKGVVVGSSSTCEYEPKITEDFFKTMSSVQAHAGLRQLAKIEHNISHRKKITELYDKLLEQKGWPARKHNSSIIDPVMVRYPLRITEKNKALEKAAGAGIELGSWFECPLHPIETPLENYDYKKGMCLEAEKACKEVVNLPLHPRVNRKTAEKTVDFITRYTPIRP